MVYTENFIDGEAFFELSEEEICEMTPPVGLAKKIMYLIQSVSVYNTVKSICECYLITVLCLQKSPLALN